MFPDASDEHWGCLLTQVPQEELDRGVPVEDVTHEPRISEWDLQRVTTALGGGQGRFRHGEHLHEVGVPFVERCAHLY